MNSVRTRSPPAADIGSDHDLLMMTSHLRLKRVSKPKHTRLKFDLEKLKDPSVLETFRAMTGGRFAYLTIMNNEDGQNTALSCTITRPTEIHQYWTVPRETQRMTTGVFLSVPRPPYPSQRSGGSSTIIEEKKVGWSRLHPSRTGPSRWRGRNYRSHDNLQQDLADLTMANPVDPVLGHHISKER